MHRKLLFAVLLTATSLLQAQQGTTPPPKAGGTQPAPPPAQGTTPAPAQTPAPAGVPAAADQYGREGYVVEQLATKFRFEKDGRGEQVRTARIRVQSEAAVQQLGQLVFPYSSANEDMKIDYVRVRKADGSVITAPDSSVQEMTAPVAREAPVYTDLRQKHVTVPALRPGEVLEYQVRTILHTPLAPGQFWTEYEFTKRGIILDEQFEVNIPTASKIKLKTETGFDPKISEQGDRRIYAWKNSNLKSDGDEDEDADKKSKKKKKDEIPDVQLTTFASWEDVGKWYAALENDRRNVTPEIRAKAEALTKDKKSDIEKIQALYDFVALNYRYVSLSFGVGRYQPHLAPEIFGNQYGDCKDKHTLLSTMLRAINIPVNTVLINSRRQLDVDLPSPSQFDHVISEVDLHGEPVWMDTTTEVAPFRLLALSIRNKRALMIPASGAAHVVTTPADPFTGNKQLVDIDGKINELGKLESTVKMTTRGDMELMLRTAFRRVPQVNWKQMVKLMLAYEGQNAEVSDVKVSDPAATREPFVLEYKTSQPNYLDWTSKNSKLKIPFPAIRLTSPNPEDPREEELKVGPLDIDAHVNLEIPARFKVRTPAPITVSRDYGEYHSDYKLDGTKFTAVRVLKIRLNDLPESRVRDFLAFRRAIVGDGEQVVGIQQPEVASTSNLPDAKADDLFDAATAAHRANNCPLAEQLYKQALAKDPKKNEAWLYMGRCYFSEQKYDDAISAYKKLIELNPYDENANRDLSLVYYQQQKYDDALAAIRKHLEVNPADGAARAQLGQIYLEQKKYKEAADELERASAMLPDNPLTLVSLGEVYLNIGENKKAMEAFDRALENPQGANAVLWNNIAYTLAKHKVNLDKAQQYAESAVSTIAAMLRNVTPAQAGAKEVALTSELAAYWDTLGWVHFQKGNMDTAEKYLSAAWSERQSGEVGDHLGQVYEKRGDKQKAIEMYARSMAALRPDPDTRPRLAALVGGDKNVGPLVDKMKASLQQDRTTKLGKLLKDNENASAYFVVVFGTPASRGKQDLEHIGFLRGSDKLRDQAEKLKALAYTVNFPDDTPTKLVRQGVMSCSSATGDCSFVLMNTDAATAEVSDGGKGGSQ